MKFKSLLNALTPWKTLKQNLDASVPEQAARRWELIGRFKVEDGMLIVFDPSYYHPNYSDPDHIYDITLQGPPGYASVFLERLRVGPNDWRNAAVKVLFSDERGASRERVGDVGVDSATLAIAIASLLPKCWMVGGQHSDNSIWIEFMAEDEREAEGKRAAELLLANGFKVKHDSDWLYRFTEPLSNEEIERANALFRNAGIRASVNTVVHHSTALIHKQLADNFVAVLDNELEPWLIAFESGWGDGTYEWFALKSGEVTVGFISQMIGE
jgi:hypothetical protein